MPGPSIYITSDNRVIVENVRDDDENATNAEMIAPTTATVTLYSNSAHTSSVGGPYTLTAIASQTAPPYTYKATIPSTVSLTRDTTYYAVATLVVTTASPSETRKITLEAQAVARY